MGNTRKRNKPNKKLQRQRELRGWSQQKVADELGTTVKVVSRWECGERKPSPFYRQKLCALFGASAEDLGFIDPPTGELEAERARQALPPQDALPAAASSSVVQASAVVPIHSYQLLIELDESADVGLEQRLGALLVQGAIDLALLLDAGLPLESLFESLRIVLQGVQAMSRKTRREVLRLGVAALIGGISIPTGKHISAGERLQLHEAFGKAIAASWKLFHTAGNAQVLTLGQAELYFVQQCHAVLSPPVRSRFYASLYNLIGMARQHQGHCEDALQAHNSAYIAALQTGDPWHVVQSLICQANGYQGQGEHIQAIETIEEALRILGNPGGEEQLRSKAHLLACWADNAMTMGENRTAQQKLEESAAFLDQLAPNEEFDRANWLQLAGKYAFMTGDYEAATQFFDGALAELPPNWIIRQILILLPLMATYAHQQNRTATFTTAEKAVSALRVLNAASMNQTFTDSLYGLFEAFPHDREVRTFVADILRQLPPAIDHQTALL